MIIRNSGYCEKFGSQSNPASSKQEEFLDSTDGCILNYELASYYSDCNGEYSSYEGIVICGCGHICKQSASLGRYWHDPINGPDGQLTNDCCLCRTSRNPCKICEERNEKRGDSK